MKNSKWSFFTSGQTGFGILFTLISYSVKQNNLCVYFLTLFCSFFDGYELWCLAVVLLGPIYIFQMKEFVIRSLPVGQVIRNLAGEMHSKYEERCDYHMMSIPADLGEGIIEGIQFRYGFAMLNYDCHFFKDTRIKFTFKQVHPVKFIHCYEGEVSHRFENAKERHSIAIHENIVVAAEGKSGHILEFKAGTTVKICSVEIDRALFNEKISCLLESESGPLVSAIKDVEAEHQYYVKGKYNYYVGSIVDRLTSRDAITLANMLLKESDSYAILAQQWINFNIDESKNINSSDFDTFIKLRNYLETNIEKTMTLQVLGREFGIGEKKLQRLFKNFTQKTYGKYIQDYRLEKAVELLSDTTNNISEVVYKLGLKNRSYFTRIFKAKYGMTPSAFVLKISSDKRCIAQT